METIKIKPPDAESWMSSELKLTEGQARWWVASQIPLKEKLLHPIRTRNMREQAVGVILETQKSL